jgi:hypothetical protein
VQAGCALGIRLIRSDCSRKFDIHREPERSHEFVKVIAGDGPMTETELGLNTLIKRNDNGNYIVVRDENIYLEEKPIAS